MQAFSCQTTRSVLSEVGATAKIGEMCGVGLVAGEPLPLVLAPTTAGSGSPTKGW